MSFDDEICPDYHACRNGAMCVESTTREGSFFCDCDRIDDYTNSFAGVSCEHESTVFCNESNEKSYTSFCTNGGSCKVLTGVADEHQGCTCLYPYVGDFCEFTVKQKVPEHIANEIGGPPSGSTGGGNSSNGGSGLIVILSLVIVLGVVGALVGYFWLQKNKKQDKYVFHPDDNPQTLPSSSALPSHVLQLEADGAVLKNALKEKEAGVALPTNDEDDDPTPEDPSFSILPVGADSLEDNERGAVGADDGGDSVDNESTGETQII